MLSFRSAPTYSMNRIARHLRNVARRKGGSLLLLLMISALMLTGSEGKEDDPARLVVRPDSSTVADESKISFFCRADGNPLPSVIWRVNGKSITDHNRISIKSLSTGLSTLRFERVSVDDNSTVVSCSADNGVANPVVAEASLTVIPRDKLPSGFPQIDLHPSLKSVEQGKTAYVSCRVRGDPRAKVLWLRDLIPLDIRSDGRYSVSTIGNPGALMIQHAREEDQGKYECIARNSLGVAHSKAANLYVKVRRVPPYFSYKLERQYVVGIGGNINLTCVAVGYPMPRVFWKKTDQMALDDPSTAPIGKNVLTLTHVESTENFTCVAVSTLGNIEATTTVIAKELPPPPLNIVVSSVTSESVVISWKPPKYNEAINKYIVKYRLKSLDKNNEGVFPKDEAEEEENGDDERYAEGRSSRGKTVETLEDSLVIDGLVAFQTYEFTVRSVGPVGQGLESLPVEAQTMTSKPASAPLNPQARSLSRDSILVKWGPCEQPNGLITGYKVYYTNDVASTPLEQWKQHEAKSDEFMTTIQGLEPDARYFVKVVGQNSEGDSPPSALVTVATRQGIPGQPPMLTVKALDSRRMQLTWEKPLHSSPVVGYTVRYNTSDGEKELTLTSPHEKHVVTGLHPDKYYYFRVAAYSDRGQGEFTEPMIAKTIASIPLSAPIIVSAAATSSKSVEVRWKGPEQKKQNGVLTAYRINFLRLEDSPPSHPDSESEEYDEEDEEASLAAWISVVVPSDSVSYVLSDLLPYSSYRITVAASTMDGYGPESASRVVKTLEDVPSAPRNFNAELTSATSVKLTWDAPAAANGALLGYYVYLDRMVNGEPAVEKNSKKRIVMIRDSTKRYFEMDGLDPNTEYSFRLNAFNRNGDGEYSERKSVITQGIPPEAPEIVSVSLDRDDPPVVARIEWKVPKMKPNETPIEKYNLWLRPQGYPDSYIKAKTIDGTDLSTTISGLWMGVVYDVLLGSENREGQSKNATETIATPVGSPDGEPIGVQYEVMKGKIVVSWRPPPEEKRNGNITSYKAILSAMDESSDRFEKMVPAPSTSSTFEVNVRRAYLFKVAAATMKGVGPYSPVLTINPDPAALVGPPTNVRVEATSNSTAVVQWDFESQKADSFVVKYMHEPGNRMDTEKWKQQPVISIDKENPKRFALISDLNAHKPYAFCVLAVKNNRQGPCSDPPTVLESVTPTFMVQNLRVRWKTSNSVQLHWDYNGPRNVGFYVNHTGKKDYMNHELQEKTMSTPGFGQDLDESTRDYLWTNLRPHMQFTFHVGVRTLPPGARKYWPQEVITTTDPTGPPYVDVPQLLDSSGTQPGQQMIKLTPATEEYGVISHYWIIVVPANYSTEDVVNLDSIELEKATAEKRAQLARSLSVSPSKKLKRKASEDVAENAKEVHSKVKRARRGAIPGAYVTARLSSDRVKQHFRNNQPFVVGDSQLYDGFTNYPLEPNIHYRLMMRAFAKNDVRAKDSFEQRAPMSEKLSRLYSDSMLTEPFTIKSALRGASQKSSPWVGACIAFLVLFSIVGMLICWWLRCNKKSAGRHPRHGSITKVALTGNIMNGGGMPGETSKLLSTSNEYGRQIMNPYEQMNGNHHMESSMDLYPLPTSHSRTNGYAPVPVPLPTLPNNGNTLTSVTHPAVPIAELANHIERLRMNNNVGFQTEFESIETGQHFTWEHSSAEMNKHKNRYANVAAYDHSRVVLSNVEGIPGMDYINANYVDGYDKSRSYIATQGPLLETFADFWRMVWEEQSVTIVMLTNLEERSRVKCDQYWPSRGTSTYGDVEVTLLESVHLAHYTMRTMRLKMIGEPEIREIKHLQYTAWPDHGVPDHPTPFLIFLKRVKTLNPHDAGPIISHCSAGIGRTGAFIVIDCMLERLRYENTVDIYGCVTALRAQRSYMVQTEEQYIFIHDAVLDAVNSGSTEVPASRLHQHVTALMQPTVDQMSGIDMEFRHLTTLKWTSNRCIVANLPVNREKNRMLSAVPYDSNRVILHMVQGIEGSDYINASWIDGYKERGAYIAMQAPLNETAEDFWRMIWEHNCSMIAMVVNTWERGQEQSSEYWPLEQGVHVGRLVVEPMTEFNMEFYIMREFRLMDYQTKESRTIRHFQFVEWPEVGRPQSAEHFLEFVGQVHQTYSQFGYTGPIAVHCTSGAGRTAVFIALSIILDRMRAEHVVDVFTTVKLLRTERQNMIQEPEQYHFLYEAAFEYLRAYDTFDP